VTADERVHLVALLQGIRRQADAALALLGCGQPAAAAPVVASREQVAAALGVASGDPGACPACKERAPRVPTAGFGTVSKTVCGACGYVYA
jgi:hypothetical protein